MSVDFKNYCVPLGRPLTAVEHADHLDAHAQLARNLASSASDDGKRYHEANAATFEFAARIVRTLTTHVKGLCEYVVDNGALHDNDCPGDDTCDCRQKWKNDAANAICNALDLKEEVDDPPHTGDDPVIDAISAVRSALDDIVDEIANPPNGQANAVDLTAIGDLAQGALDDLKKAEPFVFRARGYPMAALLIEDGEA